MPSPATYRVEIVGGVAVVTVMAVHLRSQVDVHQVRDDILAFLQTHPHNKVVVNLEFTTFCSSEVISALLRIRKSILDSGGMMTLCSLQPMVQEVIRICGLERLFVIHPTVGDAVRTMSDTGS